MVAPYILVHLQIQGVTEIFSIECSGLHKYSVAFPLEIFDNLLRLAYLASVDTFMESQGGILQSWRYESILNIFYKPRVVITYTLEIFSDVFKT